jgi:hypothetical protein
MRRCCAIRIPFLSAWERVGKGIFHMPVPTMGAEPVFFNASFRECLSKSLLDKFFAHLTDVFVNGRTFSKFAATLQ